MEQVNEWREILLSSLNQFTRTIMNALPKVLGAFLLTLIGWLLARLAMYATRKLLQSKALHPLMERLNQLSFWQQSTVRLDSVQIVSRFVYWVILLLFLVAASETLGWTAVSRTIGTLIGYLPALLSAVVILIIGLYIAQVVRGFIRTALHTLALSSARLISSLAYYIIAILVILTAMDQAGVDTSIITSNLILLVGAILVAFAISFALASKDILQNILASFYSKQNFRVGDKIRIDTLEGEIVRIDSISIVLKTASSEVVLPASTLVSRQVEKLADLPE